MKKWLVKISINNEYGGTLGIEAEKVSVGDSILKHPWKTYKELRMDNVVLTFSAGLIEIESTEEVKDV